MKILMLFFLLVPSVLMAAVDEPAGCQKAVTYPCALRAKSAETVSFGDWKVHLSAGSSVQWDFESEIRVLSGKVWLQADEGYLVFPGLKYAFHKSEVIAWIDDGKLWLKNLAGEGQIESQFVVDRGLPVGFQNWYGQVAGNQKLEQGVIQPFDVVAVLKEVQPVKKAGTMKEQMEIWKKSQSQTAEYYQRSAQSLADLEQARLKAKDEKVRAEQAERRELLRMFRERHSLDRQFE